MPKLQWPMTFKFTGFTISLHDLVFHQSLVSKDRSNVQSDMIFACSDDRGNEGHVRWCYGYLDRGIGWDELYTDTVAWLDALSGPEAAPFPHTVNRGSEVVKIIPGDWSVLQVGSADDMPDVPVVCRPLGRDRVNDLVSGVTVQYDDLDD